MVPGNKWVKKKKIVAGQRETRTNLKKHSVAKTGTVWAKKIFNDNTGL